MIITRNLGWDKIKGWLLPSFAKIVLFNTFIVALYYFDLIEIRIPWLPVSVIATAVAFYTGFKNNQAYDRMWEARKVWGGIVNDSRTWGMMIDNYISNIFKQTKASKSEIESIKKRLIYRHIAWLYTHRSQLLKVTTWEHADDNIEVKNAGNIYREKYGIGLVDHEVSQINLQKYLPKGDYERLMKYSNTATQIINDQSQDLLTLREMDFIDDFRQTQLEEILRTFYAYQGKNERIKKFPLPRQYSAASSMFVYIFILLLPFSMIPELLEIPKIGIWSSILISSLVAWVFYTMEQVGDFSENPFQGMANDIPMLSLCRTIEIDLREMIHDTDIPSPIEAKKGILM